MTINSVVAELGKGKRKRYLVTGHTDDFELIGRPLRKPKAKPAVLGPDCDFRYLGLYSEARFQPVGVKQ